MFGYTIEDLLDTSCRAMIQLLRKKKSAKMSLQSQMQQPNSERFSKTEMWLSVLSELTNVRVVNGKHKAGHVFPLLLTSSAMIIGGVHLYALLFESIGVNKAVITLDVDDETIQTCTNNIQEMLGLKTIQIVGRSLASLLKCSPTLLSDSLSANRFGTKAKHIVGSPIEVQIDEKILILEVTDARDHMYVVTVKTKDSSSLENVAKNVAKTYDRFAKGGLAGDLVLEAEEIGYYTVKGAVGVGQCGMVRIGRHRTTGVSVAVKTLQKKVFDDVGLSWPGQELLLMRYLNHPNIVKLFDCVSADSDNETLYLIMEFASKGELLAFCFDKGPLPEATARKFFRDIVSAVDYLHRKGIISRDCKLENCVLDENENVKLIDFGLATLSHEVLKTSCGSTDYAAPELFTCSQYYGK